MGTEPGNRQRLNNRLWTPRHTARRGNNRLWSLQDVLTGNKYSVHGQATAEHIFYHFLAPRGRCIIGSAEALPILCVSDFCERERERERDACDVIDITLKSRVIMHMITSTARRPNASTRSEPVECSCTCIRQGAWCLSARAAGNGRVIDECRWEV